MARTRLISLNGDTGAFVPVYATTVSRRVEVIEDYSANGGVGQGMIYQYNDGSSTPFTTPYSVGPVSEPIVLGTPLPLGAGFGLVVGTPPDNSGGYALPATLLINLRSASPSSTIARVTEFD